MSRPPIIVPKMATYEFDAISNAMDSRGRAKASKTMAAARLVLTKGMPRVEACRASGAEESSLCRALKTISQYVYCDKCGHAHKLTTNK